MFIKSGGKRKQIEADGEEVGSATKKARIEKGSEGEKEEKQNGDTKKKSPEEVFSAWILSLYDKYLLKFLFILLF